MTYTVVGQVVATVSPSLFTLMGTNLWMYLHAISIFFAPHDEYQWANKHSKNSL